MARKRARAGADEESEVPGVAALKPLASGGNSTVYRAWQPEHDRWVAVKVLHLTLSESQARDRFRRECRAVGRLTGHPNIAMILASGVTRTNRPFLTMDLFEGSLEQVEPLPVELTLHYGVKLAGALETAHRAGILHRDLKPANVLLSRFGEPALADFGIATLGEARGQTEAFTVTHAAPEVLDGEPATRATDIYGLGSTLWTALAGRLPFGDDGQGALKLMRRVLQEPLPPLGRDDVPPALEELLRWAMAKSAAERPASAEALGQRLQELQAQLGFPVSELVVPNEPAEPQVLEGPGPAPPPETVRSHKHGGPVPPPPSERAWSAPGVGAPVSSPLVGSDLSAADPVEPAAVPWGGGSTPPDRDGAVPAATVYRNRRPAPAAAAPAPDEPGPGGRPLLPFAILAGAIVASGAMVAGAAFAIRSGDGGADPSPPPSVSTPAPPGGPPSTSTPSSGGATTVAPGAVAPRQATGVAVRLDGQATALVTWKPPAERAGLVGFVVVHGPPRGTATPASQEVNDPKAGEMRIVLPAPGARCFVVQAVYLAGQLTPSEPACI